MSCDRLAYTAPGICAAQVLCGPHVSSLRSYRQSMTTQTVEVSGQHVGGDQRRVHGVVYRQDPGSRCGHCSLPSLRSERMRFRAMFAAGALLLSLACEPRGPSWIPARSLRRRRHHRRCASLATDGTTPRRRAQGDGGRHRRPARGSTCRPPRTAVTRSRCRRASTGWRWSCGPNEIACDAAGSDRGQRQRPRRRSRFRRDAQTGVSGLRSPVCGLR